MNKLLILLCVLFILAGCGNNNDQWSDVFKEMREDCAGVISYTLTHSQWNSSLTMTCIEGAKDDE